MQKPRVLAAVLAALLLVPALAGAARDRRASPAEILRSPKLLAKYLALTPEQVVKEEALFKALGDKLKGIHEQQEAVREKLQAELDKPSPDKCLVGGFVLETQALYEQAQAAFEEFDTAFTAILTAEQLVKYEALKQLAQGGGRR